MKVPKNSNDQIAYFNLMDKEKNLRDSFKIEPLLSNTKSISSISSREENSVSDGTSLDVDQIQD